MYKMSSLEYTELKKVIFDVVFGILNDAYYTVDK